MQLSEAFEAHLRSGMTRVCRCWLIQRRDGETMGFTDHDRDLGFDGYVFRADSGLTAQALQQGAGLSIDNTQASGALSDDAISEADLTSGLYNGAEVTCWLVNWADVGMRAIQFRGHLGDVEHEGQEFRAELRGLTDQLNQPIGRVFQKPCGAVLGDQSCRFDLSQPGYATTTEILEVRRQTQLLLSPVAGFDPNWFLRGELTVMTGAGQGARAVIKSDTEEEAGRLLDLWVPLPHGVLAGDQVSIAAGCDKRAATCRLKFNNLLNFQGFPDIPGDDWMTAFPANDPDASGGSRR